MAQLKLSALDVEDLNVISAHMQDAVILIGDMKFLPARHQFVIVANRFDWEQVQNGAKGTESFKRRRTGLHFNRVLTAKAQGINQKREDGVLELLSITFEETEAPSGNITLALAGGGTLLLSVECIEVQMSDLGVEWPTKNKPEHDIHDQP